MRYAFLLCLLVGCCCDTPRYYDVTSGGVTYKKLRIHYNYDHRITWIDDRGTEYQFDNMSYKQSVPAEKE